MPQFGKQSSDAKKRLQHQLYLARECPDPVFDISSCELTEIPSGVYSLCKVLQKEALLAHNNKLPSLKCGGNITDLSGLRVLDLHCNHLSSLSDVNIGALQTLQVLNLENNKLHSIPASIGMLGVLQTLNLRGNRLHNIPVEISRLKCLRSLDISNNNISVLPKELCDIETLESIIVDVAQMRYPSSGVCSGGTEAIMNFLCAETGRQYVPPSKAVLNVLSNPSKHPSASFLDQRSQSDTDMAVSSTVLQYEELKEQRRREFVRLEKQLEDDQRQQALLAAQAAANKNHLVQFVAKEHERLHKQLLTAHQSKETERSRLRASLTEAERNASELVMRLLEMSEKARKTEELLERMERERMEAEQWCLVRQEELDMIRRKDILASMERILQENDALDSIIERYLDNQNEVTRRTRNLFSESDSDMENVLNLKQSQKQTLLQQMMKEEELQKEAFEALQCQKDARHKRITTQILLIERELAELTMLEIEQRDVRLDTQMNTLSERRRSLTDLLVQLLKERDQREAELRHRLLEMEMQKLETQTDYWLAQYQRLLDSKPQSLIDQESNMEYDIVTIINNAGASDYIPNFARHHISIETLIQMSDDDLARVGVHELGVRRSILQEVKNFLAATKVDYSCEVKKPTLSKQASGPKTATAPPMTDADVAVATSVPRDVTACGLHSECVVCQDAESTVLFLNCGHVCTCVKCSDLLHECPLDRGEIVQRIRLVLPAGDSTGHDDDSAFACP